VAPPLFVDVAVAAGLGDVLQQQPPATPDDCVLSPELPAEGRCIYQSMTGGVAITDWDGDGWPDVLLTAMHDPPSLWRNRSGELGPGAPAPAIAFEDITDAAGLDAVVGPTNGALWVDVDRDGDEDLVLPGWQTDHHRLWIRGDDGRLRDESIARGMGRGGVGPHYGWSAAAGDIDGDGYVDLFVAEWRAYGSAGVSTGTNARLLRNRGASEPGVFDDVSAAAGVDMNQFPAMNGFAGVYAFAPTFVDLDGDGDLDLTVVADFSQSQVFRNRGDGTFEVITAAIGVGKDEFGMGSTFGDMDRDGDLDWYVTSIEPLGDGCSGNFCPALIYGNRLYEGRGDGSFDEVGEARGVHLGYWGWGAAFLDADNDGDLDILETNGLYTEGQRYHPAYQDSPTVLFMNAGPGAPFVDATRDAGLWELRRRGKGLALLDADRDGDLDAVIANTADAPYVLRNDGGNTRQWLQVRVLHERSTSESLGAVVELQVGDRRMREVVGLGTHFIGQSDATVHFGLGPLQTEPTPPLTLTVTWPDGRTQRLDAIAGANQRIDVLPP
jgi:hypothetical protein